MMMITIYSWHVHDIDKYNVSPDNEDNYVPTLWGRIIVSVLFVTNVFKCNSGLRLKLKVLLTLHACLLC